MQYILLSIIPYKRSIIIVLSAAAVLLSTLIATPVNAQMDYLPTSVRYKMFRQFARAGCRYPSEGLTLIALKEERRLEVWSDDPYGDPILVALYPILAASGNPGPKLERGDCQVPEGIYKVTWLNPGSRFHLSMKINYPNGFDEEKAKCDGRNCLGGDIFIHGKDVSKGCIAVGDDAIEELFMMVYDMELGRRVEVIIAPYDFRESEPKVDVFPPSPSWLPELYGMIAGEMRRYVDEPSEPDKLAVKIATTPGPPARTE